MSLLMTTQHSSSLFLETAEWLPVECSSIQGKLDKLSLGQQKAQVEEKCFSRNCTKAQQAQKSSPISFPDEKCHTSNPRKRGRKSISNGSLSPTTPTLTSANNFSNDAPFPPNQNPKPEIKIGTRKLKRRKLIRRNAQPVQSEENANDNLATKEFLQQLKQKIRIKAVFDENVNMHNAKTIPPSESSITNSIGLSARKSSVSWVHPVVNAENLNLIEELAHLEK